MSEPPWDGLNLATHVGDEPQRVRTNRELVADWLGCPAVWFATQRHGADVAVIDAAAARSAEQPYPQVDALVTASPLVALGILVADCVPVLLADPVAGVVGVAHAGRRGLVMGVIQATVVALGGMGAQTGRLRAVLGPAIGGCCYEVPGDLQEAVAAVVPESRATTRCGTPALDLPAGVAAVLRAVGVVDIERVPICTREDPRFYSHRRAQPTGRFAGLVVRSP